MELCREAFGAGQDEALFFLDVRRERNRHQMLGKKQKKRELREQGGTNKCRALSC
jgi:hypothetical protein